MNLYDRLYNYQRDALDRLLAPGSPRSQILQMPTGAGKTVTACALMERGAEKGTNSLVLVHRKELLGQFRETLREHAPNLDVSVIAPGRVAIPWAPITLASVQSLVRRMDQVREPRLVVTDEAHHSCAASYEQVYQRWPKALRLGLTATPERPDGKPLGRWYQRIVRGPSVTDLVERERLAPMHCKRIPSSFVRRSLRRRGTEFVTEDMEKQLMTKRAVGEALAAYQRYATDRLAIVFAASRKHSRLLAEKFCDAGFRAAHLDGTTPDHERDQTLRAFARGDVRVLTNVDLFGEGVDVPACDCVIMQRATMSVVRYVQDAGRAMRWQDGKVALLLDLVGNTYHFGPPDMHREWSLDGKETDIGAKRKSQVNNLRVCQFCATIFERKHESCPSCGKAPDHRPIQEIDVELVDVGEPPKPRPKPRATMDEIRWVLKQAWRSHDRPAAEAILKDFAKAHEYDGKWVWAQMNLLSRTRKWSR